MPTWELIIMQQTLECGPFLPTPHQPSAGTHDKQAGKAFWHRLAHTALSARSLGTDWFSFTVSPYQLEPCDKKGKASIHSPRASSYLLLTNWQKWISSSPCSRWQKVEKWGSLNKPIKKNNQESNSDGDPWLERLVQVVAQQPA